MPGHDIIVVGASAGGVETLRNLVKGLPADLPAAVFVVVHLPEGVSMLPQILDRAGPLPARPATDGDPVRPGRIHVGVPGKHLLVDHGQVRVVRGPRENRMRPAVDVLFRSAACAYGPGTIGVVLSGTLDDGAAGTRAIKQRGGLVVVQDPADAAFPDMPRAALEAGPVDHCVPLSSMPALLSALAREPAPAADAYPLPQDLEIENRIAHMEESNVELVGQLGDPSTFSCPECNGVLWEMNEGERPRFRCQVGHAFSGRILSDYQSQSLEDTLWAALRSLNENAALARRLETWARRGKRLGAAERYQTRAEQAEAHAGRMRSLLESHGRSPMEDEEPKTP